MINIVQAESVEQTDGARQLFREYEQWLGLDLCFQGFEEELRWLPDRYSPPDGRLFLASGNEKLAGCIALRKLEKGICEMKRLYLREDFRGLGLGNKMIETLIGEALAIGYSKMRLGTYPPKMGKAVKLYESHGFTAISPYYENPYDGVLFMELDLIHNI